MSYSVDPVLSRNNGPKKLQSSELAALSEVSYFSAPSDSIKYESISNPFEFAAKRYLPLTAIPVTFSWNGEPGTGVSFPVTEAAKAWTSLLPPLVGLLDT